MRAAELLRRWRGEALAAARLGPVLDVACGDGRNGLYLAGFGAPVLLVDASALAREGLDAAGWPPGVRFRQMDLETEPPPVFEPGGYGVVLVFRYLHRPLMEGLKACLAPGGLFVMETFLEGQEAFGKPRNPAHLLRRGELEGWFAGWDVLECFEGRLEAPPRFVGGIVCRKPG